MPTGDNCADLRRQFAQHEVFVELVEGDAARSRDGAVDRSHAGELNRDCVHELRQFGR